MRSHYSFCLGADYQKIKSGQFLSSRGLQSAGVHNMTNRMDQVTVITLCSYSLTFQQFCADYGISIAKSRKRNCDLSRTIVPGSAAAAQSIRFLAEYLACGLCFRTVDQRSKVGYEIHLLAKSNIFNRSYLVEAGTIPPLLGLLSSSDANSSAQENAISALLKLSKHSSGKKAIMDNWGLELIVKVLKYGLKMEARQTAAAILFYLFSVHEYRKMIGDSLDVVPGLIELIKDGSTCGKKNAIAAIFVLLLCHRNLQRVIASGTIPVLVKLLSTSGNAEVTTDAQVYSFVLILAEEENQYLGYLEDLYEDKKGEKMVQVRWFYNHHELKHTIPELNAHPDEVFITPHVQGISAKCVVSVVAVLTPNHYEKCLAIILVSEVNSLKYEVALDV